MSITATQSLLQDVAADASAKLAAATQKADLTDLRDHLLKFLMEYLLHPTPEQKGQPIIGDDTTAIRGIITRIEQLLAKKK